MDVRGYFMHQVAKTMYAVIMVLAQATMLFHRFLIGCFQKRLCCESVSFVEDVREGIETFVFEPIYESNRVIDKQRKQSYIIFLHPLCIFFSMHFDSLYLRART